MKKGIGIIIISHDGARYDLPVDGTFADRPNLRDSMEFWMFLARVTTDVQRNAQ